MKLFLPFAILPVILCTTVLDARAQDVPQNLQAQLSGVGDTFGPVRINWVLQRRSTDDLETLMKKLNSRRLNFFRSEPGQLIVDGVRYYEEIDREHLDENEQGRVDRYRSLYRTAFDGELHYQIQSDGFKSVHVSFVNEVNGQPVMRDYLPSFGWDMRVGSQIRSLLLAFLEDGARVTKVTTEVVAGETCTVVEIDPGAKANRFWPDRKIRFTFDQQRRYATRLIEWYRGDSRLICRTENSNWIQLEDPEHWFPRISHTTWHSWYFNPGEHQEQPLFEEELRVTEITRDLGNRPKFHIDLEEPGLYVADPREEASRKPGAELGDGGVKWHYTNLPVLNTTPPSGASNLRLILIGLNGLVFVAVAFFLFRRRTKQSE